MCFANCMCMHACMCVCVCLLVYILCCLLLCASPINISLVIRMLKILCPQAYAINAKEHVCVCVWVRECVCVPVFVFTIMLVLYYLSQQNQISWIRRRDWHILSSGAQLYTNDERFAILHTPGSNMWTLQIKFVQRRDHGMYECQVSGREGLGWAIPYILCMQCSWNELKCICICSAFCGSLQCRAGRGGCDGCSTQYWGFWGFYSFADFTSQSIFTRRMI